MATGNVCLLTNNGARASHCLAVVQQVDGTAKWENLFRVGLALVTEGVVNN